MKSNNRKGILTNPSRLCAFACSKMMLTLIMSIMLSSCLHEEEIPVFINFDYIPANNTHTAPAAVTITNTTTGADFYLWTFEGATPATSNEKQPGQITYDKAGIYTIKLEAWNDFVRDEKTLIITIDSAVTLDFDVNLLVNDFAPVTVDIDNRTRGATTYAWTFEGGTPASATSIDPPNVIFDIPGEHEISLTVSNGRESFTSSKKVVVQPAMNIDFAIVPFFKDEDYEAPLTATLQNQTLSGIRYEWTTTGGTITNAENEHAEIYFPTPGEYTVKLVADNDKEKQTLQKTITVKDNSHLYVLNDVKLGVSAAHGAIGSFYSTTLRKTLIKDEVTPDNGKLVDIVFYSINSSFSYCRFISADSAAKFTFPAIPEAQHAYVVNKVENTSLTFGESEFDQIDHGADFNSVSIKDNDTGTAFFDKTITPRVVLFERADGRKGAIRIKSFVSDGTQSYILADIKIQKSVTD